MDASRRHETPGFETEESITYSNSSSQSVSIFSHHFLTMSWRGQMTLICAVHCVTGEEPWGYETQIFYIGHEACFPLLQRKSMSSKAVIYIHIFEKVVCNQRHLVLCSQSVQKLKRPTENYLPADMSCSCFLCSFLTSLDQATLSLTGILQQLLNWPP